MLRGYELLLLPSLISGFMRFGQYSYIIISEFIMGLSQDTMQQQANLVGLPTGCSLYSASRVSAQIALCTAPCLELVRSCD